MYLKKATGLQGFGEQGLWPEGVKGKSGLVSASVALASPDWAGQASDSLKFDPVG